MNFTNPEGADSMSQPPPRPDRSKTMTTEITSQLPPCPLPDCGGGEHHYHDIDAYTAGETHDCAEVAICNYRCYGPSIPQWQPIEQDQIRAGMRIRATVAWGDRITTHTGVAHHHTSKYGDWLTERGRLLTGVWGSSTTYEVDPATIPDPDAELIEALREASWRIEHMGKHPDPLPGLPEARDLLNELRELGWTVIRAEEAGEQA